MKNACRPCCARTPALDNNSAAEMHRGLRFVAVKNSGVLLNSQMAASAAGFLAVTVCQLSAGILEGGTVF
jgi:hypothetical protein